MRLWKEKLMIFFLFKFILKLNHFLLESEAWNGNIKRSLLQNYLLWPSISTSSKKIYIESSSVLTKGLLKNTSYYRDRDSLEILHLLLVPRVWKQWQAHTIMTNDTNFHVATLAGSKRVTVYCIICGLGIYQKAFPNWLCQHLLFSSIDFAKIYFFSVFLPCGKVWGYPTVLVSWFINFKNLGE